MWHVFLSVGIYVSAVTVFCIQTSRLKKSYESRLRQINEERHALRGIINRLNEECSRLNIELSETQQVVSSLQSKENDRIRMAIITKGQN